MEPLTVEDRRQPCEQKTVEFDVRDVFFALCDEAQGTSWNFGDHYDTFDYNPFFHLATLKQDGQVVDQLAFLADESDMWAAIQSRTEANLAECDVVLTNETDFDSEFWLDFDAAKEVNKEVMV